MIKKFNEYKVNEKLNDMDIKFTATNYFYIGDLKRIFDDIDNRYYIDISKIDMKDKRFKESIEYVISDAINGVIGLEDVLGRAGEYEWIGDNLLYMGDIQDLIIETTPDQIGKLLQFMDKKTKEKHKELLDSEELGLL